MMEIILDNVLTYGVFGGMFIWLLYTTSQRNEIREDKYHRIIRDNQRIIAEQAKAFSSLSGDVSEIKNLLFRRGGE